MNLPDDFVFRFDNTNVSFVILAPFISLPHVHTDDSLLLRHFLEAIASNLEDRSNQVTNVDHSRDIQAASMEITRLLQVITAVNNSGSLACMNSFRNR